MRQTLLASSRFQGVFGYIRKQFQVRNQLKCPIVEKNGNCWLWLMAGGVVLLQILDPEAVPYSHGLDCDSHFKTLKISAHCFLVSHRFLHKYVVLQSL